MGEIGAFIKVRLLRILLILFVSVFFFHTKTTALEKREPFKVPLAILSVRFNERTNKLQEVFISYGNKDEGWAISPHNDRYIKSNDRRGVDHIYKEAPYQAYLLTDFEAYHLNKVCSSLIKTLSLFEKYLQAGEWGKLLYLDSYLPTFFKGFYYLILAARNNSDPLPPVVNVPDTLYENSFSSPLSDKRILHWRCTPDHIIKLRIVTREMIFQLKEWQKVELSTKKRDLRLIQSNKFKEIYTLFVRMYFNQNKI